ncbi:MAG: amino acid adenylation domain-containing protein, partial [Gammaproteobacteria bacterium]
MTIHEWFKEQAKKHPDSIALTFGNEVLTYQQLDDKANQLAHYLRKKYPGKKSLKNILIGLCIERSIEMIVGILGILKAGAAYVPLDPSYPQDRLLFMLRDTKVKMLLTKKNVLSRLSFLSKEMKKIICLDDDWKQIVKSSHAVPQIKSSVKDLAYVIYTSGTTGTPKGVLITHKNVQRLFTVTQPKFNFNKNDVWTLFHSYAFDFSVWEIWGALLHGGRLVIVPQYITQDLQKFCYLLQKEGVTVLNQTPSVFYQLMNIILQEKISLNSLRYIIFGGEALNLKMLRSWWGIYGDKHPLLINMYGITETTIHATYRALSKKDLKNASRSIIGKILSDLSFYIFDKNMLSVTKGKTGELYIGGAGLARGYLNRPDLTRERFIHNPLNKHERLYKTGDLVSLLKNGDLIYKGRSDDQVKIRGFRIELGEINTALNEHPDISQQIVILYEKSGKKYLVAYYISNKNKKISEDLLRKALEKKLPSYMVPAFFVQLKAFPLTPSGKINRKALPSPFATVKSKRKIKFRNKNEKILADIWQKILNVDNIGLYDDFFHIGGNSLNATQIVLRINHQFNINCTVEILFYYPTIDQLAKFIGEQVKKEQFKWQPIPRLNRKHPLKLSFAQQRLWFIDQYEQHHLGAYNIPIAIKLKGTLNKSALEKSLNYLIQRHESFRTKFVSITGKLQQKIVRKYILKLKTEVVNQQKLKEILREEAAFQFDLSNVPLIRVRLLKTGKTRHVLIINQHHIISDGWSVEILIRELGEIYNKYINRQKPDLPALKVEYADFAYWQKQQLRDKKIKKELKYWQQNLNDFANLQLPTDFPRPADKTYNGKHYRFNINKHLTKLIKETGKASKTTLFMVLLAAFNVLLKIYSNQNDIIVGSPIANRNHPMVENIIGFFVNTLVLRNNLSNSLTFAELLQQIKQTCLNAYANQDIPFDYLVEKLKIERDISMSPIFQVMFILQNKVTETDLILQKMQTERLYFETNNAKFDLILEIIESKHSLNAVIEYNSDLFYPETIIRMAEHFIIILQTVISNVNYPIDKILLLTKWEQHQILDKWSNKKSTPIPKKSLQQLFEMQVRKYPNHIAADHNGAVLTYKELNKKANQIARYIRKTYQKKYKHSLAKDILIALFTARGLNAVVSILAILKAGGAYVPLDPDYPKKRIKYILSDSQAKLILTCGREASALLSLNDKKIKNKMINLDDASLFAGESSVNLRNFNNETDLAYVIYTSGSTGKPKGVAVEHRGIVRLIIKNNYIHISSSDRIAQGGKLSFDASTFEIWGALLNGARLVFIDSKTLISTHELAAFLARKKISILWLTAAIFEHHALEVPTIFKRLKYLLAGGDILSPQAVNNIINSKQYKPAHLIDGYGPTENTSFTTTYNITDHIKEKHSVPIGKFITNTFGYILGEKLLPAPIGIPGVLYAGGIGLARGYLHRPELTKEKFIKNPFNSSADSRIYNTGDLVRWLPDGNIEFLGREDLQVKIRGFRIELGEIEVCLGQHKAIKQCVVIVYANKNGVKHLATYYTVSKKVSVSELRKFLSGLLPKYMIPDYFIELDKFIITPNGKIDRNVLPAPTRHMQHIKMAKHYVAPRNQIEHTLVKLWHEVLHIRRIGITDNFFEIGGNSLRATQVISRVNQAFHIHCPIKVLFENPIIMQLSELIHARVDQAQEARQTIPHIRRKKLLPLSFSQQRLWFLDQYEKNQLTAYNITMAVKIIGKLNKSAMEKSLNYLIQRHESFRTQFVSLKGIPWQEIIHEYNFKLHTKTVKESKLDELLTHEAMFKFDLTKAPLIRIYLLKTHKDKHVLVVNQHHIISDGWSIDIFMKELNEAYSNFIAKRLPRLHELSIQYVDFSHWQKHNLKSGKFKQQIEYWKDKLADFSNLQLPADMPRPPVKTYNGKHYQFVLNAKITKDLKEIAQATDTTLFMTLLTIFSVLLKRYSNQEDIVVGFPVANRNYPEIENIIGMFVNTLALRVNLVGNPIFAELLEQVKHSCLEAYANQDVPFDRIVDVLKVQRDVSRTPVFQVVLVLQNASERQTLTLPDLKTQPVFVETNTAQFDLLFEFTELNKKLSCIIQYNTDLFNPTTIIRMSKHFWMLTQGIIANVNSSINTLPMLTNAERKQIVENWGHGKQKTLRYNTIHQLFEQQAKKHPDNIAIVCEEQKLTYQELNQKANQLAHYIRDTYKNKFGGKLPSGALIGLCVKRSLDMAVGILAILKAGGAYVPIDPDYPQERIRFIQKDTASRIVLTQQPVVSKLSKYKTKIICVDTDWQQIAKCPSSAPKTNTKPSDLAYIIYTSGSTGTPKGVLIPHKNVIRLFASTKKWFHFNYKDIWTLFHSYAFDFSVWEFFGALLHGGKLIVIPQLITKSPELFYKLLAKEKVTVLNQTPTAFRQITAYEDTLAKPLNLKLRFIIFGGEALDFNILSSWFKQHGDKKPQLVNMYGITETTVHVTYYPITRQSISAKSVIGVPIPDLSIYVLDQHLQPLPIGIPGELYVGGGGIARGYLNRDKLTEERFITNPFNHKTKLYKTGDMARWMADGTLEYLGRIDSQVKIRGFRIEIDEITNTLLKHRSVKQCIIIPKTNEYGGKSLIAFIIAKTDKIDIADLREWLIKKLPAHMIPAQFVAIKEFPLTPHGKIDNKKLLSYEPKTDTKHYVAPTTALEKQLIAVWSKILKIKNIGIDDDFFSIGGDSILAIQIVYALQKINISASSKQLFQNTTIKRLAKAITDAGTGKAEMIDQRAIEPKNKQALLKNGISDIYMAAKMQEFMLSEYKKDLARNGHFHFQEVMFFKNKNFNAANLRRALNLIINKHHIFHVSFAEINGVLYQAVNQKFTPFIKFKDLTNEKKIKQDEVIVDFMRRDRLRPFKAYEDKTLCRAYIFKLANDHAALFLSFNHAIIDGWSNIEFLKDIFTTYLNINNKKPIKDTKIVNSYKEFVAIEHKVLQSKKIKQYWMDKLKNINLQPLFKPVIADEHIERDITDEKILLDKKFISMLLDKSKKHKFHIKAFFISAYLQLLHEITGRRDILIGIVINGRSAALTEPFKACGLFWKLAPFLYRFGRTKNITVNDVHEQLLA